MKARVHSVETFGTVDGPGIRYVVFMQGCNFRCRYCHNPDTWNCHGGEEISLDQMLEDVQKYKRYIQGVTLSGGEPLVQIEFVTELFSRLKEMGFDTCVDTSGQVFDNNDEKIKKDIEERDYRDMNRDIAPLRQAEDATLVDSSYLTIEESAKTIMELIDKKM